MTASVSVQQKTEHRDEQSRGNKRELQTAEKTEDVSCEEKGMKVVAHQHRPSLVVGHLERKNNTTTNYDYTSVKGFCVFLLRKKCIIRQIKIKTLVRKPL